MKLINIILFVTISMSSVGVQSRCLKGEENISDVLSRLFNKVGKDRFVMAWKQFNSRDDIQQDEFLTDDMGENELVEVGSDFQQFANALTDDPQLLDWYADFEQNLSSHAFDKMDERIGRNQPWWGRLKKFIFRKLEKLADEIERQKA